MLAAISPDGSNGVDVRPHVDLALRLALQSLLQLKDYRLKQRLLATRRHVTYEMTNWIIIIGDSNSLCQYLIAMDACCFGQITQPQTTASNTLSRNLTRRQKIIEVR